jgi:hypothetical protein
LHASPARSELVRTIEHVVIDGQTIPYGTTVEVSGVCRSTHPFELEYGVALLRCERINGKPTDKSLEFELCAGKQNQGPSRDDLDTLQPEHHYKVQGRLMDARFNGTGNRCSLIVTKIEPARPAPPRLAEFVGRQATFEGTAAPGGTFKLRDETATVEGVVDWPPEIAGKEIAIRGRIEREKAGLRIGQPAWHLISLDDQLGQQVALDGILWSLNDSWWFAYRGTRLYLTTAAGPTMRFPSDDHGRAVRVTGKLERQDRPALEQISEGVDRDLVPTFVVRGAKVEYRDENLTWLQRFGTVYKTFHIVRDGVPELLAEESFRRNILGDETTATLYVERNADVIQSILRDETPQVREVLARRMNDEQVVRPLRLIYAAMLASISDKRGRSFLLDAAKLNGQDIDLDALYCLGLIPLLSPRRGEGAVDLAWAEKPLMALMADHRPAMSEGKPVEGRFGKTPLTVADATVTFTSIPRVLMRTRSAAARQALLEYVVAQGALAEDVVEVLCGNKEPLSIEELLRLEASVKEERPRRVLLAEMLRHEHPRGIERFLGELESGFVYMDLRDHLSAEVLAAARDALPRLSGQAKVHAEMLLVLSEQNPVPRLLKLLDEPAWKDKNLVTFELARFCDPRAVPVVARVLRTAPKNHFAREESFADSAVEHGLEAIARTGTSEAIRELISLLEVDLARFGTYTDRAGLTREVAAHLIELTGESFGVDAKAWRAWQQAHVDFSVPAELANPGAAFRLNADSAIDLGN